MPLRRIDDDRRGADAAVAAADAAAAL